MKKASESQLLYAKAISEALKIDLPKEKTCLAYIEFISKNVDKYKKVIYNGEQAKDYEWKKLNEYYNFCEESFIEIKKLQNISGVYFFFSNGNLVYIGKSQNLSDRIISSISERMRKMFIDEISYFKTKTISDAHILEPLLISIYKPVLNNEFVEDDIPILFGEDIIEKLNANPYKQKRILAFSRGDK